MRNSWANQLLLPPEGSFNQGNLKCKNTNSYLQPQAPKKGCVRFLERKGQNRLYFSSLAFGWE